jgi:hypothetical protein
VTFALQARFTRPVHLFGGVAERQCTALEMRRPHGLVGSNPTPSAFLSRFVKRLRGPGIPTPNKKKAMAVLRGLLQAGRSHRSSQRLPSG